MAEINFADGRKTKRDLKTEVVYRSVRDALQLAFGDYGMGVLKSSLVGMQAIYRLFCNIAH